MARHGRLRQSNLAADIVRGIGILLAVLLVSGASVAAIAAWDLSRQIKTVRLANETNGPLPEIGAIKGGVNLLLVGSDSRTNSVYSYGPDPLGQRNDVTILLHISQDHTSATVVSFPRDTYVPIPACPDGKGGTIRAQSSAKINTTIGEGGLACTVLTVEKLTGLTIPFAAEITFDGVIEMSNAVGGVPVCVASRIEDKDTELYLNPGVYNLQGMDALKFLRTRYGVGNGSDLTRISSQQVFLSSLMRTVKSSATLTDVGKLYGLAGAAVRNMTFSTSLNNVDTMVQIAKALQPIDLSKMVFVQYPTVEVPTGLVPDIAAASKLSAALVADQPVQLAASSGGAGSVPAPGASPAAPSASAPSSVPSPAASGALPGAPAPLPSSVLGQTAADQTCTVGRTLKNQ